MTEWMKILFQGGGATVLTGLFVLLVFWLERRGTKADRATERSAEAATRVLDALRSLNEAHREVRSTAMEASNLLHEINRAAAVDANRSTGMAAWWLDMGREFSRFDGETGRTENIRENLYQGTMSWIEVGFSDKAMKDRLTLLGPEHDPEDRVRRINQEIADRRGRRRRIADGSTWLWVILVLVLTVHLATALAASDSVRIWVAIALLAAVPALWLWGRLKPDD